MIEIMTKIHDKFSLEFKVGFVTRRKLRHNDFSVYMWIFVPSSLDINPSTYSKSDFYRDVKSNVRLITPRFLLRNIASGDACPLQHLRQALTTLSADPTRTAIAQYEAQVKVFSAIFKSAVREEAGLICDTNQREEDVKYLCREYLKNTADILEQYRSLRNIIITPRVDKSTMECYYFGDEFMSFMLDQYTFRLINHLSSNKAKYASEIKALSALVRREQEYRAKMGWASIKENTKHENRDLIYSHGVLKKFVESALYLRVPKKRDGVMVEQIYYSLAAGLSMIFATIISFYFQQKYGNFTLPFFLVLVLSYMGKDRIKELTRYYFAHRKGTKYYDNKAKISIGGRIIGWIKEGADFLSRQKVPKEVMQLRQKSPISPAERYISDDKILLYRKWVHIDRQRLVDNNVYHTDGINDIIRLNISNYIPKMDNPYVALTTLDDDNSLSTIECKKVYYLNIVMQYQYDNHTDYKRFRVAISRSGIDSCEEI